MRLPLLVTLYFEDTNSINSRLADNLFRKKTIRNIQERYHYQRRDQPSEFADHVIELLEVALDENQDIKFLKSLSFWGDPEKAKRYKRRTTYALEFLHRMNDLEPNEAKFFQFY